MSGKFYGLSIRNPSTNVVTHNLVPVQRKADNMIGMYDTITDTFYYDSTYQNQWSAGPAKQPNYRQLEYIHFNGAEYVDTGLNPSSSGVNYDFTLSMDNLTDTMGCLAVYYNVNTDDNKRRTYLFDYSPSNGIRACIGNTWGINLTSGFAANDKIRIDVRRAESGGHPLLGDYDLYVNEIQVVNGITVSSSATTTFPSMASYPFLVGCRNTTGSAHYEQYMKGRFYGLTTQNNSSVTTHNFVPCQRKSDGVCGLYDTIDKVFKPMAGTTITGTAAGPTVNENPSWE